MVKKYSLEILILDGFFKGKLVKLQVPNKSILIVLHNIISNIFWKYVVLFVFQNGILLLLKDLSEE